MNNFSIPTTMSNIQSTELLKSDDNFHDIREIQKSDQNLKTRDCADIQQINFLFSQFQQENVNIESLIMNIYEFSLQIVLKAKVRKYFDDNFPFVPFLNIILNPPSEDCQSWGFVCLGSACHSSNFPYELFANENALTFLCGALRSEDPNIIESSLQLLSETVKKSIQSRNFLLQNNIIEIISKLKLTYAVAELLESLCSLSPPPPQQFIFGIGQFIEHLISGSELPIFELALNSLLSLLKNNAEGIIADQFQEHLIPIFFSDYNALVPFALKILQFVQNPQPYFAELIVKILVDDEFSNLCNNPNVLLTISQLFEHFHQVWAPIVQDKLFNLLEQKIGITRYNVDIELIQTMIIYYDNSHLNDLNFFNLLVRFADSSEIGPKCMEQILLMVNSQPEPEVLQKMMEQLENSNQAFIRLSEGENEDMAARADSILALLENTES